MRNKLTIAKVNSLTKWGVYSDGDCLSLNVSKAGTRSWVFRFMISGKARTMGLGAYPTVSLSKAREIANECRRLVKSGIDPIEHGKKVKHQKNMDVKNSKTFKECSELYIDIQRISWKNKKHHQQWLNSLSNHVFPLIGSLDVRLVGNNEVSEILEPIWKTKTETATRIRARIERILDWARVKGFRQGENPARWRGHLEHAFAPPTKIKKVKHFASLPYPKVSEYYSILKKENNIGAKALQLIILTATRINEARLAKWPEFDFEKKIWTIAGERMKDGVKHIVPLTEEVIKLLETLPRLNGEDFLFPSSRPNRAISDTSITKVMKSVGLEVGRADITNHGFRSTFRTWSEEELDFDWNAKEFALSHKLTNKVASAYYRDTLVEKRRVLMGYWANYCSQNPITLLILEDSFLRSQIESMVDTFMEVIKAEKSFSGPITDKDKFKESLRITAKRAIENRKYYLKQMTLTAQRALWKKTKGNLLEELSKGEPMRGFVTSHMGCLFKTPQEAYNIYNSILSEDIKINEVKSIVSRSLEARKSAQGARPIAEFNSQIISLLIPIFKEHQSHNMKKPYKISHAYSSGGYENDKGEDPKGKRVPTQFTIFCDLFFETFLNEPNLNSHKSDIILKAKKKYNSRK